MTKREKIKEYLKSHPGDWTTPRTREILADILDKPPACKTVRLALHELEKEGRAVQLGSGNNTVWYVYAHNYPRRENEQ